MPAPNNRKCQLETCDRKHWANSYCQKHDRQMREHGHILTGNYLSEQGKKARAKSSGAKGTHWSKEARARFSAKTQGIRTNTGRTHFKKGHKTWNTGLASWITQEHRAKMVANLPRGEQHPRWRGGVTAQNRKDRVRFQQQYQPQIFARDNYTCQICEQYGGSLQADHIKSWAKYPELRFNADNCRTLCMACHYYVTFKRKLPKGVVWGHNLSRGIAP